MTFLEHFIKALADKGIIPLETIHDTQGKWKRAKIEGDNGTQKTLAYRLSILPSFAYGCFQNHREGICHNWYTRSNSKKITDADKEVIKAKIAIQKGEDEKERQEANSRAAEKAKRLWAAAVQGSHPYLLKKGIDETGSRVSGKVLYVPMYDGNTIVNLQCIGEDGAKRFLTGGKKQGMMSYLARGDDSKDIIVIVEGFATGKSVREATGLPIIVAFDAGNLLPVAERLRQKYPKSYFVFAADNDQWREGGNIGIEKAKAAFEKVGGQGAIKSPDFPHEHPALPTDFNDMAQLQGIEAVKAAWQDIITLKETREQEVQAAVPAATEHNSSFGNSGAWDDPLIQDLIIRRPGSALPKPDSLQNILVNLRYNPVYEDIFAWNEFSSTIFVHRCPPWESVEKFTPHPLCEVDVTRCASSLEWEADLNPNIEKIKRAIEDTARLNTINPVREYFRALKWDGVPRIDKWLAYYCGAEKDDARYVSAVGAKWLCAGVARIFHPGHKFDYILVLEGPEGARKSTLLEELATFNGECFHTDAVKVNKLDDKDTILLMQGRIILELSELAGLGKQDMEDFKRWVTLRNDQIIKKYESLNSVYPRQFIVAATLNPADGWLDDPTGGRRFWPVSTGKMIDVEALRQDKEQLWAEAYVRFKAGEELYLRDEIYELSLKARDLRRVNDPWHETISANVDLYGGDIPCDEPYTWLKIEINRRSRLESNRIGKIMRRLGYISVSARKNHRIVRVWRKSGAMSELLDEKDEESEAA